MCLRPPEIRSVNFRANGSFIDGLEDAGFRVEGLEFKVWVLKGLGFRVPPGTQCPRRSPISHGSWLLEAHIGIIAIARAGRGILDPQP